MTDSEASRLSKRPRLAEPDGFSVAKKRTTEIKVSKFVSAFDDTTTKSSSSTASSSRMQVQRQSNSRFPEFDGGPKERTRVGTSRLTSVSFVKNGDVRKRPAMKVLKPPNRPVPQAAQKDNQATSQRKATTISSFKPPLPTLTTTEGMSAISSVVSKDLRPLRPPILPLPQNALSKREFKPLKPPPLPVAQPFRSNISDAKMKTITTTRIALMTNPSSETGSMELLGMFLKQHGDGYISPVDRELRRGLEMSPEKRNKGKGKYLRGGLAESASRLFSQSRTSLSLWETEISHRMRSSITPRMAPNLRLRVVGVIYHSTTAQPRRSTSMSGPRRIALVRCRPNTSTAAASSSAGQSALDPDFIPQLKREVMQEKIVLFPLDTSPSSSDKPRELRIGTEVWMWKPWTIVKVPIGMSDLELGVLDGEDVMFCERYWVKESVKADTSA